MSIITDPVGPQAFEIIRDRLAMLLAVELEEQVMLTANYDLECMVWMERSVPFGIEELPAVNVSLADGSYGVRPVDQSDGVYHYNVDVYFRAPSMQGINGDSLSMVRMQRLLGVCRSIIQDAKYKWLGFNPGFIAYRNIISMAIADWNTQDTASAARGRLVVEVKAPERSALINPPMLDSKQTILTLNETDKGYFYE